MIVYHAGNDPWTQYNGAHHQERWHNYYGVQFTPTVDVDGTIRHVGFGEADLSSAFDTRIDIESPCSIELIPMNIGDEIDVTAIVTTGDEAIGGNHKIRFALVSNYIQWYGTFIQHWYHSLLEFSPDPDGLDVDIAANSTQEFNVTFPWPINFNDEDLEEDNVSVVAFVQNDADQEVRQAALSGMGAPPYYYLATVDNQAHLVNPEESATFEVFFLNIGTEDDVYDIEVNTDGLPVGWNFSYTTPDGVEYGNSSIAVASFEDFTSVLTLETDASEGASGIISFNISSQGSDVAPVYEFDLYVQNASPVLVVNGDPAGAYSAYYTNAMDAATELDAASAYGVWPEADYVLNTEDLAAADIDLVLWYLGDGGTIEAAEATALQDYLSAGGNLCISGTDAPDHMSLYPLLGMMGAGFQSHYADGDNVFSPDDDDPISGDLDVDIEGGDGANNRRQPSSMVIAGDGVASLMYTNVRRAAIRNETDTYKTYIMGFPFEAIATEDGRNQLMLGILGYLTDLDILSTPEAGLENVIPESFTLYQNYPNPFNPTTDIAFSLPEMAQVTLTVFDVMGREIAVLANQSMEPGYHSVTWDAEDATSGMYFYKITATGEYGSFDSIRKMLLLK